MASWTRAGMTAAALSLATALLLTIGTAAPAGAQVRWDRGQNVAPVFEGWERNADGTFNMVFGYMNRNYEEMPHIPVGENNFFEPGPADRGQPSRFYVRRQQFVFKVQVPADWGEKDLVWTLTHQGRTDRAYASLWPVWELDVGVFSKNRGMGTPTGALYDNQHPAVALSGAHDLTVTLPDTLTLTAVVTDDGVPGPRARRKPPSDPRLAAFQRQRASRPSPNNQAVVSARAAARTGLAVTWTLYRGPGTVTFDPMSIPVEGGRGGETVTTASFDSPGTYVLRAYADDSVLTTPLDVTVTVEPEPAPRRARR